MSPNRSTCYRSRRRATLLCQDPQQSSRCDSRPTKRSSELKRTHRPAIGNCSTVCRSMLCATSHHSGPQQSNPGGSMPTSRVPHSSRFLRRLGNEACTQSGIKAACGTRTGASSRYLDFAWDASARLAFRRTAQTPYKQSLAASSMRRRRIHWLGSSHQQLITNGQPRSSTHDRLESRSARNSRQPVEQTNYDRKGEQAESGIPINSPFIEVNVRTLHALSLHPAIPLVCDGRYTCCSISVWAVIFLPYSCDVSSIISVVEIAGFSPTI
jgi:hypothetical protein